MDKKIYIVLAITIVLIILFILKANKCYYCSSSFCKKCNLCNNCHYRCQCRHLDSYVGSRILPNMNDREVLWNLNTNYPNNISEGMIDYSNIYLNDKYNINDYSDYLKVIGGDSSLSNQGPYGYNRNLGGYNNYPNYNPYYNGGGLTDHIGLRNLDPTYPVKSIPKTNVNNDKNMYDIKEGFHSQMDDNHQSHNYADTNTNIYPTRQFQFRNYPRHGLLESTWNLNINSLNEYPHGNIKRYW
jgi:hypothetical protein